MFPVFTSLPKAVGSYRGQPATLTWTLDQCFKTTWTTVQFFYNTSKTTSICNWYGSLPNKLYYGKQYTDGKVIVDIKVGSTTVNLAINQLQDNDVTYNYKCKVSETRQQTVTNTQAWILLYGKIKVVFN